MSERLPADVATTASLPTVTVVTAAYNAERFIGEALDSALAQDYPPELVDLVVVDDGSSDETVAMVRARVRRHADRSITLVCQANAGNVGAMNAGIAHARGELIALLDADDAWPPDKLRRQVAAMEPEIGLLYGDMTVIDAAGEVLQESWLDGDDPPSGRCAGALLSGNPATASSVIMRAELARALGPIPADMSWADWWLAVRAAQVSQIAYLAEPRTLYRFHGENMSLGTKGEKRRGELVKACAFQRAFLREIDSADATAAQLYEAWRSFERNAYEATELADSPFVAPVVVTPDDHAAARRCCAAARAAAERGWWREAAIGFLHAAASDPWLEEARDGVLVALAALPDGADLPGQRPLEGARGFVVLAPAEEILDAPTRLAAFAVAFEGLDDVTLALDASDLPAEPTAARLTDAVLDGGIGDDGDVDVVAVMGPLDEVGRARLLAGAQAVYSERADYASGLPHFGQDRLAELRALAAPHRAAA
jgi:hypothetical protein